MRKFWTLLPLIFCIPSAAAQVLQFADLNTREIDKLDRSKTVLIVPGGILEEHGPYLPSGSDGIFNSQLAADLARLLAARPGWKAVVLPRFRSALVPQMRWSQILIFWKLRRPAFHATDIFMDIGDQTRSTAFSLGHRDSSAMVIRRTTG